MTLTPTQLHILQHSLGCDQYGETSHRRNSDDHFGRYYRNSYMSDPDSDLTALVQSGHLKDNGSSSMCGGMHWYSVTELGLGAMIAQSQRKPKRRK